MLLVGGRLMLVSSVLGSLGNYYLSLFKMLIMVGKQLERLRSTFFWGAEEHGKVIH